MRNYGLFFPDRFEAVFRTVSFFFVAVLIAGLTGGGISGGAMAGEASSMVHRADGSKVGEGETGRDGDDSCFGAAVDSVFNQAMSLLLIGPDELRFDRAWARDDTFRLDVAEEALSDPCALAGLRKELELLAPGQGESLDRFVAGAGVMSLHGGVRRTGRMDRLVAGVVRGVVEAMEADGGRPGFSTVDALIRGLSSADSILEVAFSGMDKDVRARLLAAGPLFFADEKDVVASDEPFDESRRIVVPEPGFGALNAELGVTCPDSFGVSADSLLNWSLLVDRAALGDAGRVVLAVCEAVAGLYGGDDGDVAVSGAGEAEPGERLPERDASVWSTSGRGIVKGGVVLRITTGLGDVVIGGDGDNYYEGRFALIVDTGGNDVYKAGPGGAAGFGWSKDGGGKADAPSEVPIGAVVDMGGNDIYMGGDTPFSFGAGLMGVGVLLDVDGDDTYRSGPCSFGAGCFGVGVLEDLNGSDVFSSGWFGEGAGCVGIGILRNDGGNDTYELSAFGQGMGSTFGFGGLLDGGGNDVYRAGGVYRHEPLLPEDYRSFAQGFAIGFRPRAGGGIGFLCDLWGNDFYDAEVFAQGTSYWYSVGILTDEDGNDHYSATQYDQGAGIHLSSGILFDGGGRDEYFSRFGPSQGSAHDLSVGILHDVSGDDRYLAGGGQGLSLTNSIALFVDEEGDDFYGTTEIKAGQGVSRKARGFEGAGFFLDLEGKDLYDAASPGADGGEWLQGGWGIGIDLDRFKKTKKQSGSEIVLAPEDTTRSLEDIFQDACIWEVGSAKEKVRRARKALVAIGMPAVRYVLAPERMETNSGLVLRAIEETAKSKPDSAAVIAKRLLDNKKKEVRANAVWLLGRLGREQDGPCLEKMLKSKRNKDLIPGIIAGLGRTGPKKEAEVIVRYLKDPSLRIRLSAAEALGRLKNVDTVENLLDSLGDPAFVVRSASGGALGKFDATVVLTAVADRLEKESMGNSGTTVFSTRLREYANLVAALAPTVHDSTALIRPARARLRPALIPLLAAHDPALRAAAVRAIAALGGNAAANVLLTLEDDEEDPLVRRILEKNLTILREQTCERP